MIMSYQHFTKLPLLLKITELQQKGKLISARVRFPKLISLYKVYDFYVETYQTYKERHTWSSIEVITAFKSRVGLRPYDKLSASKIGQL